MRGRRPFSISFAVLMTGLVAASCVGDAGSPTETGNDVATIEVSPTNATLVPQQTVPLFAVA
jgi:hypothetical protein